MRTVYTIAFAVVLAFLLDYTHVIIMWYLGLAVEYPTPMIFIFSALTLSIVLYRYKLNRSPPTVIAQLLNEPDRSIYLRIYKSGEASVAEVARELRLNKVRAWRAVRRLEKRGLIQLEKRAGRLFAKIRNQTSTSVHRNR